MKQQDVEVIFQGTAFSSQSPTELEILENNLFLITKDGIIAEVLAADDISYSDWLNWGEKEDRLYKLPAGQFILPGFIDLHIHAPQYAQMGTALDKPLYDWLNDYTFPLESKFEDLAFAEKVYTTLVDHLLQNGTTTGLYFATVHREASLRLAEICSQKGQRGLVGKVVMDDPKQNPAYCRDFSPEVAIAETEKFIQDVQRLNEHTRQGVYPVITPRFIPSCTNEALTGLGKLAATYDVHIQSHCSESDWEHQHVLERFGQTDTEALASFNLLKEKTVLAHCGHLTSDDMTLFSQTGTAVAHCPISNAFFGNAITPIARLLHQHHVQTGLGTDISGGFSPSLYENIRQAVMVSQILEDGVNHEIAAEERGVSNSRISTNEAFYLATAGGGEALSLPIGRLQKGFIWDIQVVEAYSDQSLMASYYQTLPLSDILQKILYLSESVAIKEVWVQGKMVHQK